ncbi:MAG: hypothetical protein ABIU63_14665 [Chitinophagaceae bacterium]
MKNLYILMLAIICCPVINAQACTALGDETSFGTTDTWTGYIYDNINFTGYSGYVTEGSPGNSDFDESFGGDYASYATNGCPVYTETFSARYKLTKTFASGNYQFMVGADDGYRLSLDGGATWVIDRFVDQSYNFTAYSTTLSGTYQLVLEFYENGGGNRLSFSVASTCVCTGDQTIYGTGNIWNGHVYTGTNFDVYHGMVTEGSVASADFDEDFGGSNTLYVTNTCAITTETFSARYRLQKTFASNNYMITVGADDGYRLSLDGGTTWVINRWYDQGYGTTSYSAALSGTYDMVLEYYENAGGNRVSFSASVNSLLPVQLLNFNGRSAAENIQLSWQVGAEVNSAYYIVERSANGTDYTQLGKIYSGGVTAGAATQYSYTDPAPLNGSNYYRLNMVDKDEKSSKSPVVKVIFKSSSAVSIYPSLVNHTPVFVSSSLALKNAVVTLYSITGKQLQQVKLPSLVAAGQRIQVPLVDLPAGSYIVMCSSGSEIKAKQIVVVQ